MIVQPDWSLKICEIQVKVDLDDIDLEFYLDILWW